MACCGDYEWGQTATERELECIKKAQAELLANQLALAANCCGPKPCGGGGGHHHHPHDHDPGWPGWPGFPGGPGYPGDGYGGGGGGGCHCKH